MNNLRLCVFFLTISICAFSQTEDVEMARLLNSGTKTELIYASTELLQNKNYLKAEPLIDKLLKDDSLSCNFNYRKGFVVLLAHGNFIKAIPYLEIAVQDVDKNYDMFSPNERSSSIDIYYLLGTAYHMAGKIDEADELLSTFLSNASRKNIMYAEAKLRKLQIVNARKYLKTPNQDITVKNIGQHVNTMYPEYSPVISLDGTSLYFTSKRPWENETTNQYREINEDIYVTILNEETNEWDPATRLEFCSRELNEASIGISVDERRIYIYKDNTGHGDIYYSDFSSNHFSMIKPDDRGLLNTENWETHCSVSVDGKHLFFVSDREDGYGGRDIYSISRNADGTWTEPKNLGPKVNTKYNEEGVFIAIDNKTLYFSSNGETSMGGYDVYSTTLDEKGNWSTPIHLDYPLNTCGDELFYTTTIDGRRGYFTSFREDGFGEKDLYEIQHNYVGDIHVSVVEGTIRTSNKSKIPEDIAVYLKCLDCEDKTAILVKPRIRDGVFYNNVEPCHRYEMVYHYANGEKILYTDYFTSICNQNLAINERKILLNVEDPNNIEVINENAIISGVITTSTGEDLPIDLSLMVYCEDCSVVNQEIKITPNGSFEGNLEINKTYKLVYSSYKGHFVYLTENLKTVAGMNLHDVTLDLNTINQEVVEVGNFKNLKMKYNFSYNANKLSPSKGDFKRFMKDIDDQMKNGRESITIKVYSSASFVPTSKFKDNTELAKIRAENIKYDIISYVQTKTDYKDKVNVVIVDYSVNGPEYANDNKNKAKYEPFQFIQLITE